MGQLANRMGARRRAYREIKIRELPCCSVSTHMISEACAPVNWSVEPENSTRERTEDCTRTKQWYCEAVNA